MAYQEPSVLAGLYWPRARIRFSGSSALLLWVLGVSVPPGAGSAQEVRATDRGQENVTLRGERITEPNLLTFPILISVVGNAIIVIDYGADHLGLVLDKTTGRLLGRFGKLGRGPRELTAPVAMDTDPFDSSSFWLIDGSLRRASHVSLLSRQDGTVRIEIDSSVRLPLEGTAPLVAGFLQATGTIVLAGYFEGGRFARVPPEGGWIPFVPLPPGDEAMPMRVKQHAYHTTFARYPNRTTFAAATRYSDRLEIFDSYGTRLANAQRLRGLSRF